ncbi:extracellular solute-binding protein [Actinacidiphila sp. DG2A-62]|jgi:ABC-type glycerol-3-phosphate transport system substrate-binding protein|uniref:ABC transporter substrate-binding protein n=1 Tax=Actinacidiphila sp. DG2A-62 TaxID=3108821 RepID=UPI002DBF160E|nr:extracellular solute-binding protein [Actinacidiphila sp. DG2A-62]MEC3993683.1 extracellular solute-binding protein [Actinacidiphila sp. DG2A-62]
MSRIGYRRLVAVALVTGIGLAGAACSSDKKDDSGSKASSASAGTPLDPKTKVTISVDCEPPTTKKAERKQWIDDVAEFNKTYPNVTIKSKDTFPCEDPDKFTAQLQGQSETDVFYSYVTDLNQVLDAGQAADISAYVNDKTVPNLKDIDPNVLNILKDDGKLYGLPTTNYSMGLIYNRKIFKEAGLDPDRPPTTWDEIRQDAKVIQDKLGSKGIHGFFEYGAGNQGGWHLTSALYGAGNNVVSQDGTKAAFNGPEATQILQTIHDMRWVDNSMPASPGKAWGESQKAMGAGQIGMYLAAPDDIQLMVQQYGANYDDLGMAPIPGGKTSLMGGNDYFFKKSDSPDQIKAGIAWINFKFLTLKKGQFNYARNKADGIPVGLPQPFFFTGQAKATDTADKTQYATVPVANYKSYVDAQVPVKAEPPNAQKLYTVLDTVMSGVLTDKNANIGKLLSTASSQADQLLAAGQ